MYKCYDKCRIFSTKVNSNLKNDFILCVDFFTQFFKNISTFKNILMTSQSLRSPLTLIFQVLRWRHTHVVACHGHHGAVQCRTYLTSGLQIRFPVKKARLFKRAGFFFYTYIKRSSFFRCPVIRMYLNDCCHEIQAHKLLLKTISF